VSRYVREQLVQWRGTLWKVVEQMAEHKSRIRNGTEEHVILDSFLEPQGEIVACPKHHLSEKNAPLYHAMDQQWEKSRTLSGYSDKDVRWFTSVRTANCQTCAMVLSQAICSTCGRVKNEDGNCENWGCCFAAEAQQSSVAEQDVVEITLRKL
jgi:hypothetical protein